MTKNSGIQLYARLAIWVIVIGGTVFTIGFGSCLHLARKEVLRWTNDKAGLTASYVQSYVDGQLQRVEDVAYTFADGLLKSENLPDEETIFQYLEQFLNTNHHICGIAVGLESDVDYYKSGPYGFACYVTNVSGENVRLSLGDIHDFHQKEWYREASSRGEPYWSRPFRETSRNKVVTCFSLPLRARDGRLMGVIALDIDTEAFRIKCLEMVKYNNVKICLIDREGRFVSHADTSLLLHNVEEVPKYAHLEGTQEAIDKLAQGEFCRISLQDEQGETIHFFLNPIKRNGWTVSIEYPEKVVFGTVRTMQRQTSIIAVFSIFVMLLCFAWLFNSLKKNTQSRISIESELDIASTIQNGMLRKSQPDYTETDKVDVYAYLKPARSVGGDLYDYCIHKQKLYFCIGDVSGKGVPASLFMTMVLVLFRNTLQHTDNPAEIATSMNASLTENNEQNMFCTMFIGVLDLDTGRLDFCNAGHNYPVFLGSEKADCRFVESESSFPLGFFEQSVYNANSLLLKKGDCIFLYTDGVTEAENSSKKQFGDDRLLLTLNQHTGLAEVSSLDITTAVLDEVKRHADHSEQSDDITIVNIKKLI